MTIFGLLLMFSFQVSTRDFVQVPGVTLRSRFDTALDRGRSSGEESFWVAYSFPIEPGVRIESRNGGLNVTRGTSAEVFASDDGIVWLSEAGDVTVRAGIFLLTRASDGAIQRIRLLDLDENFEIRGRQVYWLGEAAEAASVDLLAGLVASRGEGKVSGLMMLMTLHDGEAATDRLIGIARGGGARNVRKNALFWLGQEVSRRAGEALRDIVMEDTPEVEVQKQAVFAISRRNDAESVPTLMDIAENHSHLEVRKQAIFWLGRKDDPRVVDFFTRLLRQGP